MKIRTKTEWEEDIIDITNRIHKEFPEQSTYMTEIRFKFSKIEKKTNKNLEEYYHSLEEVLNKCSKTNNGKMDSNKVSDLVGYPLYPASEDIYSRAKKESDINPENTAKRKTPNEKDGVMNEKDFREDMSGDDLDVPGSELDDQQESVGSEDEENNYYSLGGDDHNDLEEDNG